MIKNYQPAMSFGEDVAERYDSGNVRGDEAAAVDFLARLAGTGPALELAIGTGRIGLPLAERGVSVDGIDISQAMVAKLKEKPGGDEINVVVGDFADVPVTGKYHLIYVVFNTFFNLLTQEDQVRCFENVAEHLTENGVFVIEAFVPTYLARLRDNQYVDAEAIGINEVRLDVARHDPVRQILDESHITLSASGIRLDPIVCRYAWPSELDLMARIAGLRLKERWADWKRSEFTGGSKAHVSVYAR